MKKSYFIQSVYLSFFVSQLLILPVFSQEVPFQVRPTILISAPDEPIMPSAH